MTTVFTGKKISGILGILPQDEYIIEDEYTDCSEARLRRLKKVMGFGKRRRTREGTSASDMFIAGITFLMEHQKIDLKEIGAIVVVSSSPDYFIPNMSNIIHGAFSFSTDVICMDIPQACTGYIYGLCQAYMLLEHMKTKKVLLCTGDVLNRKKEQEEYMDPPFGGDAASVSIIENDPDGKEIYLDMRSDGGKKDALIFRNGAFKYPYYDKEERIDFGDGIPHPTNRLYMDGSAVFNFVQGEIPQQFKELIDTYNISKEDIDWYLFHQPNRFMLEKLADKMDVPFEKMPMNIVEQYGNSSGSVLAVNIVHNLGNKLINKEYYCCLSAFGAGMNWATMILYLGNMSFCEMMEVEL